MNYQDYRRGPCTCGECIQAGVTEQEQRREPYSGEWLHGYRLLRVIEAERRFWASFGRAMQSKDRTPCG